MNDIEKRARESFQVAFLYLSTSFQKYFCHEKHSKLALNNNNNDNIKIFVYLAMFNFKISIDNAFMD